MEEGTQMIKLIKNDITLIEASDLADLTAIILLEYFNPVTSITVTASAAVINGEVLDIG